jgi:hypothetical protein
MSKVLNPVSCSTDAYINCAILIPTMIAAIFVLQLLVYSELYRNSRACFPILHFFGESSGLNQTVARIARDVNIHNKMREDLKRVTFVESFEDGSRCIMDYGTNVFKSILSWFSDMNTGMTKTVKNIHQFEKLYYKEVVQPVLL